MAALIVEAFTGGQSHYHKIDSDNTTIGRALDNDIILSDLSVSPHHLRIEKNAESNEYYAFNLSDENGTKSGGNALAAGEGQKVTFPMVLWLGNNKLRLLSSDMAVVATRKQACEGYLCIFSSPIWAGLLLIATLFTLVSDPNYDSTAARPMSYYINIAVDSVLYMLGFFLIIVGISRLATHRWLFAPAISIASLLFLLPLLVEYAGDFSSYYLSSSIIRTWALNLVNFLLLPMLIMIFLMRVAHTHFLTAIGVALLVSSPFMIYQVSGLVSKLSHPEFSKLPSYNRSLSSMDWRQQKTISISDFIQEAENELSKTVLEELDRRNKSAENDRD